MTLGGIKKSVLIYTRYSFHPPKQKNQLMNTPLVILRYHSRPSRFLTNKEHDITILGDTLKM